MPKSFVTMAIDVHLRSNDDRKPTYRPVVGVEQRAMRCDTLRESTTHRVEREAEISDFALKSDLEAKGTHFYSGPWTLSAQLR